MLDLLHVFNYAVGKFEVFLRIGAYKYIIYIYINILFVIHVFHIIVTLNIYIILKIQI